MRKAAIIINILSFIKIKYKINNKHFSSKNYSEIVITSWQIFSLLHVIIPSSRVICGSRKATFSSDVCLSSSFFSRTICKFSSEKTFTSSESKPDFIFLIWETPVDPNPSLPHLVRPSKC